MALASLVDLFSHQPRTLPKDNVLVRSIAGDSPVEYNHRTVAESEHDVPTYHQDNAAQYVLPNDFPEHVRLEIQAMYLSKMMDDEVLRAPVKSSAKRCLDIGCGTGVVTDLMSDKFPQAECIGLDLSKVPQFREHNRNVRFFQGNATGQTPTEWTANDGTSGLPQDHELFDYIFSRLLILGMSNWPNFIRKEFELLKPGGWAEVHDLSWDWLDSNDKNLSSHWKWLDYLRTDLEGTKGLDLHCGERAKQWMEEAGFVDVQVMKFWLPLCGRSETSEEMRQFGQFLAVAVPEIIHYAISKAMTHESPDRIELMRADMRECLRARSGLHQYFYVTIGRKPDVETR